MTTGKIIALTRRTFVDKVMYLLFNMLSRLVITFLPRSKRLFISRLQSPSAVILETPQNTVCHCFHCFPIYLTWSDGTGCHDLSFLNVESTFLNEFSEFSEWKSQLFHSPLSLSLRGSLEAKHLFLLYWLCQSLWLCGSQKTVENCSSGENTRSPEWLPEKSVCKSKKQQLELDMKQQTGSILGKEYIKAVHCHSAYLT